MPDLSKCLVLLPAAALLVAGLHAQNSDTTTTDTLTSYTPASDEALSTGLNGLNPLGAHQGGLHLYGVSVFGGYVVGGYPAGFGLSSGLSGIQPQSGGMYGASTGFGWSKSGQRSGVSLSYHASYFGGSQGSGFLGSQGVGFQTSKKLGQRWTVDFGGTAGVSDMFESLFAPNAYSSLAMVPASSEELAAAVFAGNISSSQFASVLTGAAIQSSPASTVLYGSHVFYAAARSAVSYSPSTRLHFSFDVSGTRYQHLSDSGPVGNDPYFLQQSTSVAGGFSMTYSVTPRTQVGFSLSTNWVTSALLDSYSTSAQVTLSRTLSTHWFASVHGGEGRITALRTTYQLPRDVQFLAGGTLGYRFRAGTFMISEERVLADTYALGASSGLSAMGTWNWSRVGVPWLLNVSGGYVQMQLVGRPDLNSWRALVGLGRRLNRQTSLQIQYAYNSNSNYAGYAGAAPGVYNLNQSGVQVVLSWTPNGYRGGQ
jgi:hypothetical protein